MGLRYEHAGSAAATTVTTSLTAVTASFNIASATGWPTGGTGPFWVTIDRGNASEEKVLVASRAGTTLTVTTRGADGTTATTHASGASIEHTISATEIDNVNLLDATVTTAGGAVVTTTAVQTLTNKTLTSPVITGASGSVVTTTATQTLTGKTLTAPTLTAPVASGSLTGFGGAWTSFTPTFAGTGGVLGNGSVNGQYIQIGKVIHFRLRLSWGTTTTLTGGFTMSGLPVAAAATLPEPLTGLAGFLLGSGGTYPLTTKQVSTTSFTGWGPTGTQLTDASPTGATSGAIYQFQGTYEAA